MREYYVLPKYAFPEKIYDSDLLRRVNRFKFKYNFGNILSRGAFTIKRFLSDIIIPDIYAYSEDDRLYELFSGKQIGVITSGKKKCGGYLTEYRVDVESEFNIYYVILYSASKLADEVKPLIPHSKIIGEVVMEYLELQRLVDLSNKELASQEKSRLIDENKKNALFLKDFLDKRK